MSAAAAFLLAAVAAAPAPAPAGEAREATRGAEIATAQVSVRILRPAVLRNGVLASGRDAHAPRSQRRAEGGRVTYAFE
jgi:hypothetical protein